MTKVGRNDPCPCGSGKKFKQCCLVRPEVFPAKPSSVRGLSPQVAPILREAFAHHQAGRLAEASERYRQVLAGDPDNFDALHMLGVVAYQAGDHGLAIDLIGRAIRQKAGDSAAHNNLGNAFRAQGHLEQAAACYHQAILLKSDNAEAHNNLGNVLKAQGSLEQAAACYHQALLLKSDYAEAHNNLGNVLKAQGHLEQAAACYHRAILLKSDYAEAHNNLGNVLKAQGRLEEALMSYRKALSLRPDYAAAYNNLANTLKDHGKLAEAIASYRKALLLKPDLAEAHGNLGNAFKDLGRLEEAEACYRRALEIKPDYEDVLSNLLFILNYHPDKSADEIYSAYQDYDRRFGLPLRGAWRDHQNDRGRSRRLKVGYVSPDFRQHSVQYFLEPLLMHHDKEAVEVYAYAELSREDATTGRYKAYADHWIPTSGLSDTILAERIRADGIDILVDLAGHSAGNRLGVFARKPAPVSVSWLGYGYTTGLTAIDYFLTDKATVPLGSERLFAERPWRLEMPPFIYRPPEMMGEVGELPALKRGYPTFGTLTRSIRLNHRTIRVWSEILKRIEGARLVVDSSNFQDLAMQSELAEKFAAHGVGRDRLEMGYHSPPWDVLRGMDIGLDCFPHNSGTTLVESLYMGVPFVTLAGRPGVGRLGSSILKSLGHPEWIAATEDEYVAVAVALASDLPRLEALRSGLRSGMKAGPLMDEVAFARKVEAAYREMWVTWCESV